jgi:hypothetical protein
MVERCTQSIVPFGWQQCDARGFARWMCIDEDMCPEDIPDAILGQNLRGSSRGNDLTAHKHCDPVAIRSREIQIMRNRDNRQAGIPVKFPDKLEDIHLMGDVEMSIRFIEKENTRLLCQCTRNEDPLSLTTGERCDWLTGQMRNVGKGKHVQCNSAVLWILKGATAAVRRATHQNHFQNGKGELRYWILRDKGNPLCKVNAGVGDDVAVVKKDATAVRNVDAIKKAQQRCLSRTVGPDKRQELTVENLK